MSSWERWLFVVLILVVLGILGAGVAALWGLREGIPIRISVSGELTVEVEPTDLSLRPEGPVEVVVRIPEEGFSAKLEGAIFPKCEDGVLIPVRWNPLTGEVSWKCVPQEEVQGAGKAP